MKAFSRILLAGLLAGGVAGPAFAQATASDDAAASITVIRPITIASSGDLAFGTVIRGAGTVAIAAANGNRTTALTTIGAGNTRAVFDIGGESGQNFSITAPATIDLTGSVSGTLTVTLAYTATGTQALGGAGLGNAGTFTLGVGGTLTLAANTPTGLFSGTIPITVDYQ